MLGEALLKGGGMDGPPADDQFEGHPAGHFQPARVRMVGERQSELADTATARDIVQLATAHVGHQGVGGGRNRADAVSGGELHQPACGQSK